MISTLKKKGEQYYCSECMMRQPAPLKDHCYFCGNWFSNYENIIIMNTSEKELTQILEVSKNENDIL